MVSKEELAQCFKDTNYSEEQINKVLNSKINSILKKGNKENIISILQKLEELKINKDKVINGLTILLDGKAEEIESVFNTLRNNGISKEAIENRIRILTIAKEEKINSIMKILIKQGVTVEQVENNLDFLVKPDNDQLDSVLTLLNSHNVNPTLLDYNLIHLLEIDINQIDEILKELGKYKLDDETIKSCLKLISTQKGNQITEMLKTLNDHKISKETIEITLKELLRHEPQDIDGILTALEKNDIIKEKREELLKLIRKDIEAKNGKINANHVDKMLADLKNHRINKERIESNISIIMTGKSENLDEILTAIEDFGIRTSVIEQSLSIVTNVKLDELNDRITALKDDDTYNFTPEDVENCMSVLCKNKADEMEKVLKSLKAHKVGEENLKGCLTVLAKGKADKIDKIYEVLDRYGILVDDCMTLLAISNPEKIENNLKSLIIDYGISRYAIQDCLSILGKNDFDEIQNTIKVLQKYKIGPQTAERCLSVLALSKPKELDEMLNLLLVKHHINLDTVKNSLSSLVLCKTARIGKVLDKLVKNRVDLNAITGKLSLLIKADADDIDGIIGVLRENGLNVEENISVISYTNAERLREIAKILKDNGIKEEIIQEQLRILAIAEDQGEKVEDIFDNNKIFDDEKYKRKCIKRYIILNDLYGKYYTKDDVEEICEKKNITIDELLTAILTSNKDFVKLYRDKIMKGETIYIGPAKPMDMEYVNEHGEEILDLSKVAAYKFMQEVPPFLYDLDELIGDAQDIILYKCGNFVENLKDNHSALRASIIMRTVKYLYTVGKKLPYAQVHRNKYGNEYLVEDHQSSYKNDENKTYSVSAYSDVEEKIYRKSSYSNVEADPYSGNEQTGLKASIDYEKAEFSKDEAEIMECMIALIEEGEADDLYKKIAQNVVKEEEEVIEAIHSIRQKMIKNKLVEQRKTGGYQFNREDNTNAENGHKGENANRESYHESKVENIESTHTNEDADVDY